jgi:hypothetical protein
MEVLEDDVAPDVGDAWMAARRAAADGAGGVDLVGRCRLTL